MDKPKILRKRYIPFETVDISSDEVLERSETLLKTRWNTIKPRGDISYGVSYALLKDGIKISKIFNSSDEFVYWYCDIIDVQYDKNTDTYTLEDLLVDVVVRPDGTYRVLDADELADALEQKLITTGQCCRALKCLDTLLKTIYQGTFPPSICKE
jgi:hypothetical protein